jgi:hypothetical protein
MTPGWSAWSRSIRSEMPQRTTHLRLANGWQKQNAEPKFSLSSAIGNRSGSERHRKPREGALPDGTSRRAAAGGDRQT